MADYGLNFGFRRSGGDAAVREGRYRVPAGDTTFYQGDLVTAGADYTLEKAASGAAHVPGITGLLIQEYELFSIYGNEELSATDSRFRGQTKQGYLATIWSGAGLKIWLRNTPEKIGADGFTVPARQVFNPAGVSVGGELSWNGTQFVAQSSTNAAVLQVTEMNEDGSYLEAVVL